MMVLVSILTHPSRPVAFDTGRWEVNRTPGYAAAVKAAISRAVSMGCDLVIADADGYHPPEEIRKLEACDMGYSAMVKPYRSNLGFQSAIFSALWQLKHRRVVRDVTGGMYRLSYALMVHLPALKSEDMTIHLEILKYAADYVILQYPYTAAENDRKNSHRTRNYQLKLLAALVR